MTSIKLIYLGGIVDRKFNGFFHALGIQALREQFQNKIQELIKDIDDIEQIIEIIKNTTDNRANITLNSVFVVDIDGVEYPINSYLELMEYEDFCKRNFIPYIKFDKSNADITRELQRINNKIAYLDSIECIDFIKQYIQNLPKQYKIISCKPKKIFLYHSYGNKVKEFLI